MGIKIKIGNLTHKERNLIAKDLAHPLFRAKVLKSKKKYSRKNTKIELDNWPIRDIVIISTDGDYHVY